MNVVPGDGAENLSTLIESAFRHVSLLNTN